MTHGIGTDIVAVKRLEPLIADLNDPFIQKTFTKNEISLIMKRPNPLYSFCTRFAGKEAVFKCLCINGAGIRLIDIEILELDSSQPYVILHGSALEYAQKHNLKQIHISLSYETDYALAYALAETIDP